MLIRLDEWIYVWGIFWNCCFPSQLEKGPLLHYQWKLRRAHLGHRAQEQQAQEKQASQGVHFNACDMALNIFQVELKMKLCVTLDPLAAETLGVIEGCFYIRILDSVTWEWHVESYRSRSNAPSLLLCQGPQEDQRTSPRHLGARAPAEETQLPQAQPWEAERVWKWGLGSIFLLTTGKPPAASTGLLAVSQCAHSSCHHPCIYGLSGCISLTSAHRWLRAKSIILQTPAFERLRLWVWVGLRSWFAILTTHWNWLETYFGKCTMKGLLTTNWIRTPGGRAQAQMLFKSLIVGFNGLRTTRLVYLYV